MSKENTAPAAPAAEKGSGAKKPPAVYSAAELIGAARKVFGVSPDIATAALRMSGIKSATVADAKKIITEFANKEVK